MKHVDGYPAILVMSLCALAVALTAPPAGASGGFAFEKVVLQGEAAPGTEPGTVFGPLGGLCFPPELTIDDQGRIAFPGRLLGPAITPSNDAGLWSGNVGGISLLARAGSQAPGVAPGGVFSSFPFDFALFAPTGGTGRFGFSATLTGGAVTSGTDEGLWVDDAQGTALLAREGSTAPGPAGLVFTDPFGFQVNSAGHGLVDGSVSGAGVTTTNNEAFWTDRLGTLAPLLREGDAIPGVAPGVVIGGAGEFLGTGYTFLSVTWSEDSKLAVVSTLTGPGITTYNNEILLVERANGHTILAREDDQAPGFPNGANFGGNSILADFGMVTMNKLGQTAFTARVGSNSIPIEYPIFSDHTGTLAPLVRTGDPAPGTSRSFGIVAAPVLSDGGRIAFRAALLPGGQWPPLGVWWDQPGQPGEISALVVPGDPAPGRPGLTIGGVNFIHGFNAAGQMAFDGALFEGENPAGTALLLAEPTGDLQIVVATGDLVDAQGSSGDGSDLREVGTIIFGRLNASGQMAVRLDFTDGTFGFYVVSSAATSVSDATPVGGVRLARNVPNPFGSSTRLEFDLSAPARVGVTVFDASGRLVSRLLDEPRAAGRQTLVWDGRDRSGTPVSSGIYWARIETAQSSSAVRMVLVRH